MYQLIALVARIYASLVAQNVKPDPALVRARIAELERREQFRAMQRNAEYWDRIWSGQDH